ncbi:MAG: BolA/IbaG family iron-sulfur metabolism protein [Acidobacteriota bacterium]|nr:BolA/IbaG family iron-sulfur metabolism protein [Acidobacteriota bacterium]MDE3265580.1 BolA/IbaG family iron-sulfur metabolism protein [Acidobacteriota bacterium]
MKVAGQPTPQETAARIRDAVTAALPDAVIDVSGEGNHFSLRVESAAFGGKRSLARQRIVLRAIAHLMKGDAAPVHAIDRLETVLPADAEGQ